MLMTMMSKLPNRALVLLSSCFLWSLLLLLIERAEVAECVNLEKYDQLTRDDLLELDREVSRFYYDSYEKLDDEKQISYDEQLFRSVRAIRHTNVLNQFDYVYTDERVMRRSAGRQVSQEKCLRQLEILDRFAQQLAQDHRSKSSSRPDEGSVPLSAIDMLEASARPEPGVLNGNFIWFGAYTSCKHAQIPYKHIDSYYRYQFGGASPAQLNQSDGDIVGRYCVAHLRAKSWPQDDQYFGNRISLKSGLCLPESCHTNLYVDSPEIHDRIQSLTKYLMTPPFDGDQYEVSYLYCLPDEDSAHRQWDLGMKLFLVFVAVWSLLLLYSNIGYQRRLSAMKKLSESIDIKMIVDQQSPPAIISQTNAQESPSKVKSKGATAEPEPSMQNLQLPGSGVGDATSSNDVTPMPSDAEEDPDGEFQAIKPVLLGKRLTKSRSKQFESDRRPETLGAFDFIKAFAIKANIDFLFRRADFLNSESRQQQQQQQQLISQSTLRRISRELQQQPQPSSPATRRLSASNAALIKDLEIESNKNRADQQRQARRSKSPTNETSASKNRNSNQTAASKQKRVNIDVLDGIKVCATAYIIYSHTLMFFFGIILDIRFGPERMMDFVMIATINGLQVVGLFYIVTGVLISYLAFSRQKVKQLLQPSFWIIVVIGRYLRLLPTYLLVFWFAKHVAPHTGSGPWWLEYRTDSQHPRGYCSGESWLTMLSMSAADVKIPYDCVPQAWYLSNDFRTLLIIPFYIVILAMNTAAGYAAILSTLIFSAYRMTHILREAHIDYKILLGWQPHVYNILADRLHDVYTNLAIRLSTYLLGVIVGHILYLHEQGHIKRMPRWFKQFGLKAALLVGSVSFMYAPLVSSSRINQYLPSPDSIDSDTVVMLVPLLKTTMELCICLMVLSLSTGGGFKWLSELLSSQPARVLSNMSYGVFLVHIEIMYKTPLWKYESNYYYLFLYSAFFIVVSNVMAFFVHVLYEMPINNVLRYVFKKIYNSIVNN